MSDSTIRLCVQQYGLAQVENAEAFTLYDVAVMSFGPWGIDFGEASHVPFHEELFWEATNTVVIGGGNVVYFFDTRGDLRAQIPVPSLFGHLAVASIPTAAGNTEELLFILGWTDVYAIDSQFETAWVARGVAVDGIVFIEVRDDAVILSAEMDPPGGWVNVALDVRTGAELWRER